jgi:hypothetical protein
MDLMDKELCWANRFQSARLINDLRSVLVTTHES